MYKSFIKNSFNLQWMKEKLTIFTSIAKSLSLSKEKLMQMSTEFAFIRNVSNEDRIQIKFDFPPTEKLVNDHELASIKSRTFNFNRAKMEDLGTTLLRISSSVSKVINLKRKRKVKSAEVEEIDINVQLFRDLVPVSDLALNANAWENDLTLVVCDISYKIKVNQPTILSIVLPKLILTGFPIYPNITTEFSDEQCKLRWYIEWKKNYANFDPVKHASRVKDHLKYELVGEGNMYVPTEENIGRYIKVECDLDKSNYSAVSSAEVAAGPKNCPFEKRQKNCQPIIAPDSFRIVTYNILADLYASQDFSLEFIFPYCPPEFIKFDYRRHLLKKEIFGYNADIFCLQEVDKKFFDTDLMHCAKINHYDGMIKLKSGDVAEGCATFFNKLKFEFIEQKDAILTDIFQDSLYVEDIRMEVEKNQLLKSMVLERSTILQTCILKPLNGNGKKLLVATTHLYFHPKATHVRLIQMALIFRHLEHIVSQYPDDDKPSLILCGDFNSSPTTSIYEFIVTGKLPPTHADWYIGGKPEYAGFPLSHSFKLMSACNRPRYTNYVAGFRACIDYIFVDVDKFIVGDVIEMPAHDDVVSLIALPNELFPSDHLAVGCTLRVTK